MDKKTDSVAAKKEQTVPSPTPIEPTNAQPKGPRNYLAMMLLATLMLPTGLARAYRGEKAGWTRFWVYVGANAIMIIPPFIGIFIGGPVIVALIIWGIVDFIKLYKVKTDADGNALVTTPRDEKFAKGFFIYILVSLVFVAVMVIAGLALGILGGVLSRFDNPSGAPQRFDNSHMRDYNTPDAFYR